MKHVFSRNEGPTTMTCKQRDVIYEKRRPYIKHKCPKYNHESGYSYLLEYIPINPAGGLSIFLVQIYTECVLISIDWHLKVYP